MAPYGRQGEMKRRSFVLAGGPSLASHRRTWRSQSTILEGARIWRAHRRAGTASLTTWTDALRRGVPCRRGSWAPPVLAAAPEPVFTKFGAGESLVVSGTAGTIALAYAAIAFFARGQGARVAELTKDPMDDFDGWVGLTRTASMWDPDAESMVVRNG